MKRTLSNPYNDNEPLKKRRKRNSTPPLSDDEGKPEIKKSSTITSNTSSISDEDNECCICFNNIDLSIKLDCGHQFCFLCLKEIRMQSSDTFNLATFNCNDSDNNDNDNNNNNNSSPKQKKHKKVEKFSCPYCRREYDVKVIDEASMKKTEWMNDTTKTKKNANNKSLDSDREKIIIWQYSGRKGGWWAYQKGHKKEIEKKYKIFVKELKMEQEKEEKAQKEMDRNNRDNTRKYGLKNNNNNDDDDDDDLGKEAGLSSHECMIEIGVRKYVINFAQMIQFDFEYPTRKRKIRRRVETKHTLQKSDSLKGCAGKFFNDNKNKRDK